MFIVRYLEIVCLKGETQLYFDVFHPVFFQLVSS